MKRVFSLISGGILVFVTFQAVLPARAQEITDQNIWHDTIEMTDLGQVTGAENKGDTLCENKTMRQRQVNVQDIDYLSGGSIVIRQDITPSSEEKDKCLLQNSRGLFGVGAEILWAEDGNPSRSLAINISGASIDPAPSSDVVLVRVNDSFGYNLSINYDIRSIGKLAIDNKTPVAGLQWKLQNWADVMRYNNGSKVAFLRHSFSRNGQYLAGQLTNGNLVVINLFSKEMRQFGYETSSITSLTVSSAGENVAVYRSGSINLYDASLCGVLYSYENWSTTNPRETNCLIENLYSKILGLYPYMGGANTKKLRFSSNNAQLTIDAAWKNSLGEIFWQRFEFKPQNYTPKAKGYLAMGDSYSSGEGDNFGGTWHETGTDEQGDKATFNGRNLCHLSRRSYSYLIAIVTGYLLDNTTSPTTDGDFHSVSCSGAKIHNIIGAVGEKQDDGGANDFVYTDNQYRFENQTIGGWLPGYEKQKGYINGRLDNIAIRNKFNPSVLTVGIGGNDFDFGGFLGACTLPGTCEQAIFGSEKSERLIKLVAQNKSRLVNTYKTIKELAPESRIYVHGYPNLVNPDPNAPCGINVRFDSQERLFISQAVTYINSVVQAAALEAGVFYVNVENIFQGRALCDSPPVGLTLVMNGVTAGNDIDLGEGSSVLGVNLPKGVCIRNCIGAESMHPNSEGFKLYKESILSQTNSLNAPMSEESPQNIPLPDAFFGESIRQYVDSLNNGFSVDNTTLIADADFIKDINYYTKNIEISQSNLLPGSFAELYIESEPTLIGTYEVNTNGELDVSAQLPDIEPGYHEAHLVGFNRFGQKVDIYKSFYIATSVNDFDGDGVLDLDDSCILTTNVFIDVDKDSVDDACDINVTVPEPPVEEDLPPVCVSLSRVLEKVSQKTDPHPSKFRTKNPNYLECFSEITEN